MKTDIDFILKEEGVALESISKYFKIENIINEIKISGLRGREVLSFPTGLNGALCQRIFLVKIFGL